MAEADGLEARGSCRKLQREEVQSLQSMKQNLIRALYMRMYFSLHFIHTKCVGHTRKYAKHNIYLCAGGMCTYRSKEEIKMNKSGRRRTEMYAAHKW
jgi:hypothetical protein